MIISLLALKDIYYSFTSMPSGWMGCRFGLQAPSVVNFCESYHLVDQNCADLTAQFAIHPASRGVAAHTAGLFRSVRGAKGGFPPWGLPKLRSFTSPPRGGLPKLGNFHFSPPWGLPKLGNFHFSPPWRLPKLGNFHFSPPWGLPKLGNFHFSPP